MSGRRAHALRYELYLSFVSFRVVRGPPLQHNKFVVPGLEFAVAQDACP